MEFIGETLLLLVASTILLRLAGKKSIAQMSSLEVIIILGIGTTMGHAIKEHKLWQIIVILTLFVIYLVFVQYLQLKFTIIHRYISGNAIIVILNGQIEFDNLKKLRMTTEQLEAKLRQEGISYISDVKTATLESDGGLGYELMEHARPITRKELLESLHKDQKGNIPNNQTNKDDNIFEKVPGYIPIAKSLSKKK
ncbi:DUF421 domain-containing protein [Neobacillus vireti]|uniref:DUF421 domain-containing protein n=1 Tax=Neobacillus vireti TaxID=220686 RepID=UPI002FFDB19F